MSEPHQMNIPYPPNEIFKYRKNIIRPASQVLEQANSSYVLATRKNSKGEYVPDIRYINGEGIFACFEKVPHLAKGHPFPEALYALNAAKRLFINLVRLGSTKEFIKAFGGFMFLSKKNKIKLLELIIQTMRSSCDMFLTPYYLEDGYYSSIAKEIRTFTVMFLMGLGINEKIADLLAEIIAMFFQWDNAYYFRFGDIMSESNKEAMLENPRKELLRLVSIINQREAGQSPNLGGQIEKNTTIGKVFKYIFLIPSVKRSFKLAIKAVDFEKWKADEADKFHTMLWSDYKFGGKTLEQRVKKYEELFKGKEFPPRIEMKPNS